MAAAIFLSTASASWAQGITVKTKDGNTVDYPAEQFSHISPYIYSLSSTSYSQGVVATLQYEKLADMKTARADHQTFASGEGFVVAGGHTSVFLPVSSAELWQNGQWKTMNMSSEHDAAFSVTLADGRIMIGGGHSAAEGNVTNTDIYNPATQTFTAGPSTTIARSNCKAIATSRGIYVSGNLGFSDNRYDFYNGTTFAGVGNPDGRLKPYLFTDSDGNIYPLSTLDNSGKIIELKKSNNGTVCLYGEKYYVSTNKDYYYFYSNYTNYMPLTLPADIRSEQYHRTDRNGFFVLTQNSAGAYLLTEPCADQSTTYNHKELSIPTQHPVTNEQIEWRGGVYVNNAKNEAYIIGTSLANGKYTLHIISYNFKEYYWTIASASGFSYDLKTASWTLLNDGRMACSGGYDGNDMRKEVYIFTLPKAGAETHTSTTSYGVDVFKADGTNDRYMESSLECITTYKAAEDEPGEQQTTTVPQTGAKLSMGDLTIDMPAGAFSKDTEVTIAEEKKGFVDGEDELSTYYKVHFAAGVHKGFKAYIKMPRQANDDLVRMQFAMMGWATSINQEFMVRRYMDVTYENGAYVAEIPEMESPDDVGAIDVWFGITRCHPLELTAPAKQHEAGRLAQSYLKDYMVYDFPLISYGDEYPAFCNELGSWIAEAITKLEELGYEREKGSCIDYYLVNLGEGGTGGFYTRCPWGKSSSSIFLNYSELGKQFKTKDYDKIKATILHETFHYYQWFYDSRKVSFGHSEATILEEASSVWSEHFYTATPGVAADNANLFVASLNPNHEDVVAASKAMLKWRERFQNVGYGMSTLLEYLTKKCGNQILHDMWEDRKTGDPENVRDRVEYFANRYGIDIFTQDTYHDFVEKLGCGEIYEDLNFHHLVNYRNENGAVGVLSWEIKDTSPVSFANYLYEYGALVERLTVSGKYDNDQFHGLDHATGMIEQPSEGMTTWVYRRDVRNKYYPCGVVRKGTPLKINSDWFYKVKTTGEVEAYSGNSYNIYFVTIPDDFKTTAKPMSKVTAQLITLDVSDKKLSVAANDGMKTIKVKTNYDDLIIRPTADWISCFLTPSDSTLTVRYNELPDNSESRTATIQFALPDADGKPFVLEEIELTQAKAFIDLSETEVEVPVEGGTKTFTITATNCTGITVSTGSNFLHPTISGNTITVKIDENTGYDSRYGTVDIVGVMPLLGISVPRNIHFNQAGTITPEPINLYDNGYVEVEGQRVIIPGKTMQFGDYLLYRSADTQIERNGDSRKEYSWDVNLYFDPKDNKSMRHYEFYSGSVTWLENRYWKEQDSEGKWIERQRTTRCSYNLKNLRTTDGLSFDSWIYGQDNDQYTVGDFVSDYSYEETLDGQTVNRVTQVDIASHPNVSNSARVYLSLADGVPYLEADRDTMSFNGAENLEYFWYSINDVVTDVKVTATHDWMTIEKISTSPYNGNYRLSVSVNKSKAPREGQVNLTATLADGSQLTRTIIVRQSYEAMWDDDWAEIDSQKAELPSQAVLDALQNAGMPLYLGSAPPTVQGTYKMDPLNTIYNTNGEGGGDDYVKYLVISMATNTSDPTKALMSYYSHLKTGEDSEAEQHYCHLSGSGQNFTLSNIKKVEYEGLFSYTIVTVISGTIDNGKILNLHFGNVELDDGGNIENVSVGNDGDGVSEAFTN